MSKNKIIIKSPSEVALMIEGGKRLADVKLALIDRVAIGVTAEEIENLATDLLNKTGGEPSFKKVKNYKWSTCVNVNDSVVHGIPKKEIIFKKGDVVSIDVGLFYKGFHTDTSFTIGLSVNPEIARFLQAGHDAVASGVQEARPGNRIYDISKTLEKIEEKGYTVIRSLVGHGVGRELHEEPYIPCYVSQKASKTPEIPVGGVLAIELMYTPGTGSIYLQDDGWTIATVDGKISALFEDTVAVTQNGPLVLTETKYSVTK